MRLANVDLNLLVALEMLLAERNVTRAGQRLHLSQPAMSGTLARLRRLFDDPLVVRRGNVTSLTPFAESLIEPVHEVLERIEQTLRNRPGFDPATDTRTFSVIASDYVVTTLLPPLLRRLDAVAPNTRVTIEPIWPGYVEAIAADQADLLIMPNQLAEGITGLPCQKLFSERFVCAVWRDNTEVGATITIEDLQRLPYLAYRTGSTGLALVDLCLDEMGVTPRIEAATGSFAAVPFLLSGTRLIATMHERFAKRVADATELRLLDLPVEVPPIVETMYWHPRRAFDPGHRWLRTTIADVAAGV